MSVCLSIYRSNYPYHQSAGVIHNHAIHVTFDSILVLLSSNLTPVAQPEMHLLVTPMATDVNQAKEGTPQAVPHQTACRTRRTCNRGPCALGVLDLRH